MNEEWSKIYDEHAPSVRAILYRMGLDAELDDLVQECFIKVWKNLGKFRGGSKLKTWITRIAINCANDHFRRKGVDVETEEMDEEKFAEGEINHLDGGERELLRKALGALSVTHRQVLVLHFLEELPIEEIAEVSGVSVGTVKSRLHHARANLHKILMKRGLKYE